MSLTKLKSGFSRKGKEEVEKEIFRNTLILIKKTFQDLASLKKFVFSLILMLMPLLITIAFPSTVDYGSVSAQHGAASISIAIIFLLFFWTLGIAFICIIGTSGASLISE